MTARPMQKFDAWRCVKIGADTRVGCTLARTKEAAAKKFERRFGAGLTILPAAADRAVTV